MFTRRDFGKLALGAGACRWRRRCRVRAGGGPAGARPSRSTTCGRHGDDQRHLDHHANRIFPELLRGLVERDYMRRPNRAWSLQPKLATKWEQERHGLDSSRCARASSSTTAPNDRRGRRLHPRRRAAVGREPFEPRGKTFTAGFERVEATDAPDRRDRDRRPTRTSRQADRQYRPGRCRRNTTSRSASTLRPGADRHRPLQGDHLPLRRGDGAGGLRRLLGRPAAGAADRLEIVPEFAGRLAGLVVRRSSTSSSTSRPTRRPQLESYDEVKLVRRQVNYPAFAFNTLPDPPDNPLVDARPALAMVQGVNMDEIVGPVRRDHLPPGGAVQLPRIRRVL